MVRKTSQSSLGEQEFVAGNGLLHRRVFLAGGASLALSGYALSDRADAAAGLPVEPWMQYPTTDGFAGYGSPSRFEKHVVRTGVQQQANAPPGLGSIRTPLHRLDGTITPNGLHFVRLHSGVPDIDPDKHKLLIHGLVDRPLIFTLDTLAKYPMESRIYFLECGGNSQLLYQRKPVQAGVQRLHGQICCSDWTGVRLVHAARRDRRQAECEMDRGGRRRRFRHGAQRAALQDHGRRVRRALPERRAAAAGERLSDAAVPARLPGQRAGEVSAPHQGHRRSRPIPATRPRATRSRATTAPRCNSSW